MDEKSLIKESKSIVDKFEYVKAFNEFLSPYGFSVFKLLVMVSLFLVIYFIRKVIFDLVHNKISQIESLKDNSKNIIESIRKITEILVIFINIELTFYVYNDFASVAKISMVFNIIYAFIITMIVYKIVNTIANIKLKKLDNKQVKYEVINVGIKIVNFLIMIIGLLVMLYLGGVQLTAVISGLGIGGFAVALAAKDSLANFFGTLSILFSDIFSQGDWIAVDGKEGTVIEIGLRVTKLRTFDNAMIAIPNSVLANKDVKNYNKRTLGRRIKMSLGVKYDSKPANIQKAVDEIYTMLDKHPGIVTRNTKHDYNPTGTKARIVRSMDDTEGVKKTLLVYLDEFGASSINILVYCFTKSVRWAEWLEVKQDVMFKMMEIFEKNDLEFAFPSLSVYHENEAIRNEV